MKPTINKSQCKWGKLWIYRECILDTITTPRRVLNHSDCCTCCSLTCVNYVYSLVQPVKEVLHTELPLVTLLWIQRESTVLLRCRFCFSHGLTDFFQALLDAVNHLHCGLWDPRSWAEDGAHAALV